MLISSSNFLLVYAQGSTTGSTIGSGSGWIELVLIEAKELVAADLRGTSDPYVRVQYGNLKKRTKV
jgi:Ca2+-dependent lipid-binding protein